jgi:hypothetical protein
MAVQHRCNRVVTFRAVTGGNNYRPGVGREGKSGGQAFGQTGRASFTLYVLLGPSLAVGVALAGFGLTRDRVGQDSQSEAPAATTSPSASPTNGSLVPQTLPGPAATFPRVTDARTATPTASPSVAAPTVPPSQTNAATTAPVPSTSTPPTPAPTTTPTPAPTTTPSLPTLPPIPTAVPTLPRGLP